MPRALVLAVVAAAWSVSSPSAAYVPPAEELVRMWSEMRNHAWGDAVVHLSVSAGTEPATSERLELKRPERLRQRGGEGHRAWQVVREDVWAVGQPAKMVGQAGPPPMLWAAFLMPRGGRKADDAGPRLMALLQRHGIAAETAIGRLPRDQVDGDRAVYIIGAKPWQRELPQIWLDKETLVPRRTWIDVPATQLPALPTSPATEGPAPASVRLETRLDGWEEEPAAGRLPRVIEEWVAGHRVRRSEVQSVRFNARLPAHHFEWDARR